MKLYLVTVAVVLVPVALSYGVDPAAILPKFMNIKVEGTDQTHILRALMCLYFGMSAFCIVAAFTPGWGRVAVIWAVFFMFSLVAGRVLSLMVDGMPSRVFLLYLRWKCSAGSGGFSCSPASDERLET
jgi:hypothetical protein